VKLLFDQNLSFKLPKKLEEVFPGSSQVKLLNMEQADDPEIWEYAQRNGFTLVSKDSDYYDSSALRGHPPKVIWLRCGNQRTSYVEKLIRSNLDQIRAFEADPTAGCYAHATRSRLKIEFETSLKYPSKRDS
jgi:predicted nuclease of predicted toxin-antitoxin system